MPKQCRRVSFPPLDPWKNVISIPPKRIITPKNKSKEARSRRISHSVGEEGPKTCFASNPSPWKKEKFQLLSPGTCTSRKKQVTTHSIHHRWPNRKTHRPKKIVPPERRHHWGKNKEKRCKESKSQAPSLATSWKHHKGSKVHGERVVNRRMVQKPGMYKARFCRVFDFFLKAIFWLFRRS